jgi:parvulin-like peptidyl-prolyl isomerase
MRRGISTLIGTFPALIALVCAGHVLAQGRSAPGSALVTVNKQAISAADLERMYATRRVPVEKQPKLRRAFLEEMVDAEVMRQFLAKQRVKADPKLVQRQVTQILGIAAEQGGDAAAVLQAQGYTEESLRKEFELPFAWQAYVEREWSDKKLREFFAARHEEFDGTKIRARHIFLKVDTSQASPELSAALEQLRDLRERIVTGGEKFADVAATVSEAPTRSQGGDLGEFTWHGKMPAPFSAIAFKLRPGEVSGPITTRAGVHLCQLVSKTPGDLGLEDVRKEVFARVVAEEWTTTVARLRKEATITWNDASGR